jgi:hypothetical protein
MNIFSKIKFSFIIFIPILFLLFGCKNTQKNTNLNVDLPQHITYSGRGVAAGIALMGVIGPSGIAIGAAIDIGIGKDIQSINSKTSLLSAITKTVSDYNYSQDNAIIDVDLKKIEFKQKDGDESVFLLINGVITLATGEKFNFNVESDEIYELTKLKTKQNYANEIAISKLNELINNLNHTFIT